MENPPEELGSALLWGHISGGVGVTSPPRWVQPWGWDSLSPRRPGGLRLHEGPWQLSLWRPFLHKKKKIKNSVLQPHCYKGRCITITHLNIYSDLKVSYYKKSTSLGCRSAMSPGTVPNGSSGSAHKPSACGPQAKMGQVPRSGLWCLVWTGDDLRPLWLVSAP